MVGHGLILVPVDFSQECPLILESADGQAFSSGASLLLLHVVQFRDPMRQRPPEILLDPLQDCSHAIKKVPSSRISILALEGEPVRRILETAESYHPTRIIMGRGGTQQKPGHVAIGVKEGFAGQVLWVSRFGLTVPADTYVQK